MICKYLPPFCELSFHFLNGIISSTKGHNFDVGTLGFISLHDRAVVRQRRASFSFTWVDVSE